MQPLACLLPFSPWPGTLGSHLQCVPKGPTVSASPSPHPPADGCRPPPPAPTPVHALASEEIQFLFSLPP